MAIVLLQSLFLFIMFIQAYINTAKQILKEYGGQEPFHSYLKKYFEENKKFGSRDRKYITHLCYCFFRLGKSLNEYSIEEKLVVGVFLCSSASNPLLEKLNKDWNEKAEFSLDEKVNLVQEQYHFIVEEVFPWQQHLSDAIEYDGFTKSFFVQPDIFLRLRPGKENIVKQKLAAANIPFQTITDHCIAIAPATKLEEVIEINNEAVIQDLNSQRVFDSFIKHLQPKKEIQTAWDCCAASGGKSILLKDIFPDVQLTVSDIRESILINLKKRFEQAGIRNYRKMVADIATSPLKENRKFDLIICDAPCSGSGTWSRTPEQLYFFDEKKIDHYSSLQKKIAGNAVKNLKTGGFFVYITCSVFKKENEEIVQFLQNELSLPLLSSEYLKGNEQKADTLFTTVFTL
jgi:16S rRNA (cytosine967-C5)-methyltransferase